MGNYDDIINLPYNGSTSKEHPRMSMHKRAAQFAPFAALTGHNGLIAEAGRMTETEIILDEDEKALLDYKMQDVLSNPRAVKITYYEPDILKEGGRFCTLTGNIKKADTFTRNIIFTDGSCISMDRVIAIDEAEYR